MKFLLTLPNDKDAREKKIEYLDYWNNEPEKNLRTGHAIFSVWFHVTDPTQMALIHVGILLAIGLFTLGLFTRGHVGGRVDRGRRVHSTWALSRCCSGCRTRR